jgi:hypothetical protein
MLNSQCCGAAYLVLCLAAAASAAERVVWQVGTPDHSYREFAIAANYPAFAGQFGTKPVAFEPGRSDAAKDWPFIQPGPADGWAGGRVHPFAIRFRLPERPQGVFTLRVELIDTNSHAPPTYAITVGGRTGKFRMPSGGGDGSLTNPAAGKPQKIDVTLPADLFQTGANEIVLACVEGSWVQYDAVTLRNDPDAKMPDPNIQNIAVAPTPFFIRSGGGVRRAVDVSVGVTAPVGDLTLQVEAAGQTTEIPVRQLPHFGSVLQEVPIPDSQQPLEVKVTARVGGRTKTASAVVPPQRKWRIYVAPSSHTDIGYTDVQPKCAARHNENVDAAIKVLRNYPDFRWNLEVAWQAENYMTQRSGDERQELLRLAREGRLGIQALYCNILTGLCSHEQACRLLQCAHELCAREKLPFESAMISDVPTQEASLPMLLAGSGIRYFSSGINNSRAYTFSQFYGKCPCWWEGPDGSRVLMMYMPGYAHAAGWGLDQSVDRARQSILANIRSREGSQDYPYDALFLHGAVGDNCPLNPRLAEVAKEWNERYEYPKVILCRNAEFYQYIEQRYGDQLPVLKGSAGTYWEDGAGSSARETALCRNAHETVANAEKFLALVKQLKPDAAYPAEPLEDAWRNCMLYDEHTWGAHCSITQPESDFTKAQWKIKAQFAVDADQQSKSLWDQAALALASLVRTDAKSLLVINPTSWPRTDILRVQLPDGMTVAEPNAACCDTAHGTCVLVQNVPACGYRVLKLAAGARPKAEPLPGTTLDSRFYRVSLCPTTGAVTSIVDKATNRELVDGKAPYRVNQYLYVAGGNNRQNGERIPTGELKIATPEKATIHRWKLGSLGEMIVVESAAEMTPKLLNAVTVWNDVKRVDFADHVTKKLTYEKEAVYFAFPFAAEKPTFRYEIPAGVVCANTDMLAGACLDWFTVQHFVEVEDGDAAVAWATPDAPLVCFQDINRGKWQTALPWNNGHIYAYLMNNYWFTNYLAGQSGEFTFRFSITSGPKGERVVPARFGAAVSNPLSAVVVDGNPTGVLAAPAMSLVTIDEPNVLLVGARQARRGGGLLLRLWEVNGQATTAHVRLSTKPAAKATACNLVEEPLGPLELREGKVAVPIRASGLATVRIE